MLSALKQTNLVLRPQIMCGVWGEPPLGKSVRERLSKELTFRLSINEEKEPTMGRAGIASQAVGTAYANVLR